MIDKLDKVNTDYGEPVLNNTEICIVINTMIETINEVIEKVDELSREYEEEV